jgi:hypothetical protein
MSKSRKVTPMFCFGVYSKCTDTVIDMYWPTIRFYAVCRTLVSTDGGERSSKWWEISENWNLCNISVISSQIILVQIALKCVGLHWRISMGRAGHRMHWVHQGVHGQLTARLCRCRTVPFLAGVYYSCASMGSIFDCRWRMCRGWATRLATQCAGGPNVCTCRLSSIPVNQPRK